MVLRNVFLKSFYVFVLAFLFVFFNQRITPLTVKAQDTQWSTPQTIPGYHPETWPPILIADQNRTVHAFSSQWIGEESGQPLRAIVYNRWTFEQGWTTPTDIILSPNKEARITDAYLDKDGMFHVVFFGGDSTGADIYYSKAPIGLADNSQAWSTPVVIGEKAGDPEGAVFIENAQGTLQVIYNGREQGNGLYVTQSIEGGKAWSNSFQIFLTNEDESNIAQVQVIKGKSGWLHAIWGVYNTLSQGRGVYYARSMDGTTWNEPILLADAQDDLGTQMPTMFEYNETLIALYIKYMQANKIIMRSSNDEGENWDDPSMIFPRHEGVNGSLSLVVDSKNDLHLFFGQRIPGSPDIHGMWHSTFLNNRWIEPEWIVRGTKKLELEGYNSFDPNAARAVVSQGNIILVTWRTDPGSKGNGVWFSYKEIDAPELPVVQLPTAYFNKATPTVSILEGSSSNVTPDPSNLSLDYDLINSPSVSQGLGKIFFWVILIVVLIIVAITASKIKKSF